MKLWKRYTQLWKLIGHDKELGGTEVMQPINVIKEKWLTEIRLLKNKQTNNNHIIDYVGLEVFSLSVCLLVDQVSLKMACSYFCRYLVLNDTQDRVLSIWQEKAVSDEFFKANIPPNSDNYDKCHFVL